MSDDPIEIVAKLDDDKEYSLAPFIEYFIDRGFNIRASQVDKESLSKSLQDKLVIDENFTYISGTLRMFCEAFFLGNSGPSYPFNEYNYHNIYLPNKEDIELDVFPDEGDIYAYQAITITDPKDEGVDNVFKIGLLNSFLQGRLLVISVMYESSKRIMNALDYDEEETSDIGFPLYPIIFRHFDPLKILYVNLTSHRKDFYSFFSEEDKDAYRDKFANRMTEDPVFMTDYYNKGWCYQDYIDTGILYRFFDFSYYQILLYQKYADNFNCPQEELDKAWAWYRENDQRFLE